MGGTVRREEDLLGARDLPEGVLYGVQTLRAMENFSISPYRVSPLFVEAMVFVKKAAALTNLELGYLEEPKGRAILQACDEVLEGKHREHFVVDPFQGGAGTSTHMNVNEVLARRAEALLGAPVSPLEEVNLHQSTNDVYPTALRVASLFRLKELEREIAGLQEALQRVETREAGVVKLGRTQLQDAVPLTTGLEIAAWAEAFARDRWRIFKCRERLKTVNLGGTAVGTGLGAPREYIFRVSLRLKELTGLNLSRSENLVEATQNLDPFVEVSGILKTLGSNLLKITSDMRLLASGPQGGLGELLLPQRQPGSTVMPGKVNPVIPEAVGQVALRVMGNDQVITAAASLGQLELNPYLPLIAFTLLESLEILSRGCKTLRTLCVEGMVFDGKRCRELLEKSRTLAYLLLPKLGYHGVEKVLKEAEERGETVGERVVALGLVSEEEWRDLTSPENLTRLGFTEER